MEDNTLPDFDITTRQNTRFRPHRNLAFFGLLCYSVPMPSQNIPSTPFDFAARHAALEAQILERREKRAENARKRAEARTRAFGDLCEATEGLAAVWRREGTPLAQMLGWADGDLLTLNALARWLRRRATREIDRLRHAERRPFYYEQEKTRRQALAAERRRTSRRTTENPCPTKEQILVAWEDAQHSNEGVLRFGSLLEDLACYVDASLLRTEDGAIVGRRGGVKAWLQTNIPALYLKYKTVMAYKATARKLKQITSLADPVPAARLVEKPQPDESVEIVRARVIYLEVMSAHIESRNDGTAEFLPETHHSDHRRTTVGLGDETRRWPRSRTAWMNQIEAFSNPERVAEATTLKAWKERYKNEITVRTKSNWVEKLSRLWQRTG